MVVVVSLLWLWLYYQERLLRERKSGKVMFVIYVYHVMIFWIRVPYLHMSFSAGLAANDEDGLAW